MTARLDEPVFIISVAARLVEMHPQTLRKYEREGLIAPSRTHGNLRLYSDQDIERLRQVKYLVESRGLNLAGVQLALELTEQLRSLKGRVGSMSQAASQSGKGISAGHLGHLFTEMESVLASLGFVEEPRSADSDQLSRRRS
jgi:MerR family transcriptional regulator, heat shock protein HspR